MSDQQKPQSDEPCGLRWCNHPSVGMWQMDSGDFMELCASHQPTKCGATTGCERMIIPTRQRRACLRHRTAPTSAVTPAASPKPLE